MRVYWSVWNSDIIVYIISILYIIAVRQAVRYSLQFKDIIQPNNYCNDKPLLKENTSTFIPFCISIWKSGFQTQYGFYPQQGNNDGNYFTVSIELVFCYTRIPIALKYWTQHNFHPWALLINFHKISHLVIFFSSISMQLLELMKPNNIKHSIRLIYDAHVNGQ